MAKETQKAINREEHKMRIREVEIEGINNELKRLSVEVIQLKKELLISSLWLSEIIITNILRIPK